MGIFGESWYEQQYREYRDKYNEALSENLGLQAELIRALRDRNDYQQKFHNLLEQWNDLINVINEKGGEAFLQRGRIFPPSQPTPPPQQFNEEEIKQLIILCHPDKHDGRSIAHNLTVKLLAMKRKK